MERQASSWTVMRGFLLAAVLAVFAGGIWMLVDFFASGGGQPADIKIPPPPPPPAEFLHDR